MTQRLPRFIGPILLLVTLFIVALIADFALGKLASVPDPYSREWAKPNSINPYIRIEYPRNYVATTDAEPGLPGVVGPSQLTTNNVGFRGDSLATPKPADEYRVFMVGGSSTECFYLDDDATFPRVAERELSAWRAQGRRIRVYNVGLSGAASDDHLAMVSHRLLHLEPDLIVVSAGINDLRRAIVGFDYLHFDTYGPEHWVPNWKRALMKSQIARRIFYLRTGLSTDPRRIQEDRPMKSQYGRAATLQRSVPESDALPREDVASYERNLRSLVGMLKANGVSLVLVTQPTTWDSADAGADSWHWMRHYEGVTYREAAMDAAMERVNDVTRRVAAADSIPVYDIVREIPRTLDYFYDDCHFNTAGAAWVGSRVAAFLAETMGFEPAAEAPAASPTADSAPVRQ